MELLYQPWVNFRSNSIDFCIAYDALISFKTANASVSFRASFLLRWKNFTSFIVFIFVFQWCNKDVRCKKLQLTDLLVSPVHHIMKIPLVIREIESRTDDPEEKGVISRIHEMKEHSLSMNYNFHYSPISFLLF